MVVFLLDQADPELAVSPASATRLADLGITEVNVLHNGVAVAIVVEGWAFGADRAAEAAVALGAIGPLRVLQPSVQVSVDRPVPAEDHAP